MKIFLRTFLLAALPALAVAQIAAQGSHAGSGNSQAEARQIVALANEARIQAGLGRLDWDPALADAALAHCERMAEEGPIAHQYSGEADLTTRTAEAGAHFSVIEENVALGPSADAIHEAWMHSPGHRANLLSPEVDRAHRRPRCRCGPALPASGLDLSPTDWRLAAIPALRSAAGSIC